MKLFLSCRVNVVILADVFQRYFNVSFKEYLVFCDSFFVSCEVFLTLSAVSNSSDGWSSIDERDTVDCYYDGRNPESCNK